MVDYLEFDLEDGAKELVYKEIANHDGGISKEDLVQYAHEIADANGIKCEKGYYNLAEASSSHERVCICYGKICLCVEK